MYQIKIQPIAHALLAGVAMLCLSACGSDAPKPLTARNISEPMTPPEYLPLGLATSLKKGDAVDLKAPSVLLLHPQRKSEVAEKLDPGTLVRHKARPLTHEGPGGLVDPPSDERG